MGTVFERSTISRLANCWQTSQTIRISVIMDCTGFIRHLIFSMNTRVRLGVSNNMIMMLVFFITLVVLISVLNLCLNMVIQQSRSQQSTNIASPHVRRILCVIISLLIVTCLELVASFAVSDIMKWLWNVTRHWIWMELCMKWLRNEEKHIVCSVCMRKFELNERVSCRV